MSNGILRSLLVCCCVILMETQAHGESNSVGPPNQTTEVALEEVEVSGTKSRGFIEEKKSEPRTESTVTKEAIQKLGGPAQVSVYQTLRMLPSVTVETADPYGLNTRSPFNFRVRGQPGKDGTYVIERIAPAGGK